MRLCGLIQASLAAAFVTSGGVAYAQAPTATSEYPVKTVRTVVSYAPGGATDIMARVVAQKLTEALGRSFVVDNQSGAGGVIGDALVARAAPDGYTLLATSSTFAINPAVVAKLPFDAVKSFAPIGLVAQAPFVLTVHPALPAKSVKELIALAKTRPGTLDYASAGQGTAVHLATALFSSMAGVSMTHVPYKGTGPALIDLLAGQVQLTFANILSVKPYVQSGRLRALGVSSAKRSLALPELPTVAEAGVPGYEVVSWYGWLAPAATPPTIVQRLNSEIRKIVQAPDVKERFAANGAEPLGGAPDELGERISREIARWRQVVREARVRVE
jgi:tripartite-type tricarboxylate transporter receptor subunit TctC